MSTDVNKVVNFDPWMFEYDDAFFNRNWAEACRGRWAGPGLLAGWDAGFLNCLG